MGTFLIYNMYSNYQTSRLRILSKIKIHQPLRTLRFYAEHAKRLYSISGLCALCEDFETFAVKENYTESFNLQLFVRIGLNLFSRSVDQDNVLPQYFPGICISFYIHSQTVLKSESRFSRMKRL